MDKGNPHVGDAGASQVAGHYAIASTTPLPRDQSGAPVTVHALTRLCSQHGIAPSRFGRRAVGDPRLVHDLRLGRTLRPATEARIRQFIETLGAGQ